MSRRAVFLDRDGTLIADRGYLGDPSGVSLLAGVVEGLERLREAGYLCVVITNQSGIGRGRFSRGDFFAVEEELARQLEAAGTGLDAVYVCPHVPTDGCTCRKPGTALHREAAAHFDLDLRRCWHVGDRPGDFLATREIGGQGLLVRTGEGDLHEREAIALGAGIAHDLRDAARLIAEPDAVGEP